MTPPIKSTFDHIVKYYKKYGYAPTITYLAKIENPKVTRQTIQQRLKVLVDDLKLIEWTEKPPVQGYFKPVDK